MIATAITFALSHRRLLSLLGVSLAVIGLVLGIYLKGRHDAAEKAEARRKVEVAAAIKSDAKANTKGLAVAQQQAERAAQLKEDLVNAVAKAPDNLPDESSVRWGCEFMRHQGRRPSDIPECRALGF